MKKATATYICPLCGKEITHEVPEINGLGECGIVAKKMIAHDIQHHFCSGECKILGKANSHIQVKVEEVSDEA